MSEEWITTKEAAKRLKTSRRYVVNMIHQNRLKARRDGKLWLVHISLTPPAEEEKGISEESYRNLKESLERLNEDVVYLRGQLDRKDQQIEGLQKQLDESRERSDTIILQLTRQLDQSQRLLEYHRSPWWRRWFGKEKEE